MSRNKNKHQKSEGYKPVECQSLEREVGGGVNITPPINPMLQIRPDNPFTVSGFVKLSKSGLSLSIRINDGVKKYRYLTIAVDDVENILSDVNRNTVATVREYDNSLTEQPKSNLIIGS